MKRETLIAAVFATAAVLLLVLQWSRLSDARRGQRAAELGLVTARSHANEVAMLRAKRPVRDLREPPNEAFIRAVNATLTAAGLDPVVARGIDKQDARASGDGQERSVEMRIDLQPITLSELGGFLAGWARDYPAWEVVAVSMSKMTGRQSSDQSYRVLLTCRAEYALAEDSS